MHFKSSYCLYNIVVVSTNFTLRSVDGTQMILTRAGWDLAVMTITQWLSWSDNHDSHWGFLVASWASSSVQENLLNVKKGFSGEICATRFLPFFCSDGGIREGSPSLFLPVLLFHPFFWTPVSQAKNPDSSHGSCHLFFSVRRKFQQKLWNFLRKVIKASHISTCFQDEPL